MSLILKIGNHFLIEFILIHHGADIVRTSWSPRKHLRSSSLVQLEFIQEGEEEPPNNAMNKVQLHSLTLDSSDRPIVKPLLPLQPLDNS